MSDDRFKAWLTFWQFVLGTVVLGVFSTIISNQIQTRELEIKEQEANAKFLEQALQEDVGVRRRLSQYFSHVTRSEQLRTRWGEYAKLVEVEYQDKLKEKVRLEAAAQVEKDAQARNLLTERIADLNQQLSPKPAATALSPRVYIHIAREDQRSAASSIANALRQSSVVVPGIELVAKSPQGTELRYFRQSETAEAEGLASTMRALLPELSLKYVPGFESSTGIRARHYELWIAASSAAARGK